MAENLLLASIFSLCDHLLQVRLSSLLGSESAALHLEKYLSVHFADRVSFYLLDSDSTFADIQTKSAVKKVFLDT